MTPDERLIRAAMYISFWHGVNAVLKTPAMMADSINPTTESQIIRDAIRAVIPPSELHRDLEDPAKRDGATKALVECAFSFHVEPEQHKRIAEEIFRMRRELEDA